MGLSQPCCCCLPSPHRAQHSAWQEVAESLVAEVISSPWNPLTILRASADSHRGPPTPSPQNSWRITIAAAYPVTISAHLCSESMQGLSTPRSLHEHVLFPPSADKEISSERADNMFQVTQ